MMTESAESVLRFWFEELEPKQQFGKDEALDQLIKQRFGPLLLQARAGELYSWRSSLRGRLAEIIVLDQFSRNIYRDQAGAFAADALALCLAQEAVGLIEGHPEAASDLSPRELAFILMPYMHSESRLIQAESMRLFAQPGLEDNQRFAEQHRDIIERFGRYPHRNAILERESTAEELEFLAGPGSSF